MRTCIHSLLIKTPVCALRQTSQTSAAVVVFPTPGGPESRAALNPEPSSFPPPNLPNLGTVEQKAHLEVTDFLTAQINRYEVSRFLRLPAGLPVPPL